MAASFATFWYGPRMSGYEAACIRSFLVRGHSYTVYGYEPIDGMPDGAQWEDAANITPQENLRRFLIRGRPNLSHFSDLFRYEMFRRTPHIWVDTDMLALREFDLPHAPLLAREDASMLCGAILRLDAANPALDRLIARTLALRDQDLVWGATGPRLLTEVFGRATILRQSLDPAMCFPVHYDRSWMLFLPECHDECAQACAQARTLHLWNDRVVKIGVWKRFGPPAGSFLESCFRQDGSLPLFEDFYPAPVMRAMVENWRHRCEGGDIGLGQWLRQAVPSARLTWRRRLHLPA